MTISDDFADLLTPISDASPAGAWLRYSTSIYDDVAEARRDNTYIPNLPPDERKEADPERVLALTRQALSTQTKDLQLAAFLTEALARIEGYAGLTTGLDVLREYLDRYWDTVNPPLRELDRGDPPEMALAPRAAALGWIDRELVVAVRSVPLNRDGHSHLTYAEARDVGYEAEVAGDATKIARRTAKLTKEMKLAPEEFDKSVEATEPEFYRQLGDELAAAVAALDALAAGARERFGDAVPRFLALRGALDQVQLVVAPIVARKCPPPVVVLQAAAAAVEGEEAAETNDSAQGPGRRARSTGPSLRDRALAEAAAGRTSQAVEMLMREAAHARSPRARFLRRTEVARVMVDAGLEAVALPLLQQLVQEIDAHKLDQWEAGSVVAEPIALLWRCLKKLGKDDAAREQLHLRVCCLDPVQAISLAAR